ncbi:MAG: outer membrane efflux protein [uncultured bacterium]|nr:MAG: outer membrane efflux protein [uncultured bacterium]
MRVLMRFVILLHIIFFPFNQSQALTLDDALEIAQKHPVLQSHDLNIRGREHEAKDANAKGASSISFNSENFGGSQRGFSNVESSIEFSLPIQDRKKVKARTKLARARIDLSKLEKTSAAWIIQSQTQRAFHRALTARLFAEKAEENIENAQKMVNAAQIMVEAGSTAEREVFQAELLSQEAKLEHQSFLGRFEDAKADLAIAMGLDSLQHHSIEGSATIDLQLPAIEELEKLVLSSHPEILVGDLLADEVQSKLAVIRAENRPGWEITAGARNLRETSQHDFLIGITVELPRARDNKGERQALKYDLERLALEKANKARELRLQLLNAWQKFTRLQNQSIKIRDEILPASYHLFELALTGYQLGKTDQIVVLQTQKEFLSHRDNYLQNLEELYEAMDYIESLAGPANTVIRTSSSETLNEQ